LADDVSVVEGRAVFSSEVLAALQRAPDSVELAEAGLRRALLAGWARSLGLMPTDEELEAAEAEWWRNHRVKSSERESFLGACGLDGPGLRRLCEERALERLVLAHAQRLLSDGPSWEEALPRHVSEAAGWKWCEVRADRSALVPGEKNPWSRPVSDAGRSRERERLIDARQLSSLSIH
jgi:hypothetical protein